MFCQLVYIYVKNYLMGFENINFIIYKLPENAKITAVKIFFLEMKSILDKICPNLMSYS